MHLVVGNSTDIISDMRFINNGIIRVKSFIEIVQNLNKKNQLFGHLPHAHG
jgi:hypothetical protein